MKDRSIETLRLVLFKSFSIHYDSVYLSFCFNISVFFLHPQSLLFGTHSFTHFALHTFYCLLFLLKVSFISLRTGITVYASFCSSNNYSSRVVSISMLGMPDVFSATSKTSLLWKPPSFSDIWHSKHAHAKPGMPDVFSAASKT